MTESWRGKYRTRNEYLWHMDSEKVRCKCGHIMKNHWSTVGSLGGGCRHYSGCKFCGCKQFEDEDDLGVVK